MYVDDFGWFVGLSISSTKQSYKLMTFSFKIIPIWKLTMAIRFVKWRNYC